MVITWLEVLNIFLDDSATRARTLNLAQINVALIGNLLSDRRSLKAVYVVGTLDLTG
jgi:hypothetical protein